MHSTGNYIQYLIIPIIEKNLKKNRCVCVCVCVCVPKSLSCTPETNTTL